MKRKQQINSYNTKTNELKSIFEIALNSNTSDIYFIDKSFPFFHISFHKDSSVWIRSNNRQIKANRIFSGNSDICEGLVPILFYFPTANKRYPLTSEVQNKYIKFNLNIDSDDELESHFIKLFKLSGNALHVKIVKEHTNATIISSKGTKLDGTEEKMVPNHVMPILGGKYISLYLDIHRVDKQKEFMGFKRMLFIIEPNKKVNLQDLFNPKNFIVDVKAIRNHLISKNEFKVKETKICCYIY